MSQLKTMKRAWIASLACAAALAAAGCGKKADEDKKDTPGEDKAGTEGEQPKADLVGVDMDKKVVRIGALNDESGPAKQIGVAFANGKRLLAQAVNAGDVQALPEGWKIELVEKDQQYNPQQAVQLYKEIAPQVLFIGTSFGTPATLPLLNDLQKDDMIAFPASLSSKMAENEHTPPLGPSYKVEAMRAMDWAVEHAGGADKVKAGIVYQRDDYGEDGIAGWNEAAEHHGVEVVAEQTVTPKDQDFTAVVKALKDAGANYVLITTLPTQAVGILGTAAKMKFAPTFIGNTPAWVDAFFEKAGPLLGNFYWVTGLTYWGEDVPGMDTFVASWDKYGKEMGNPDFYILASYVQGMAQLEALKRAIESGDLTRAGYKKALHSISNWNAGGMIQPIDLTETPYVTSTRTRILKPNVEGKTWEQVADWAEPAAMAGGAADDAEDEGAEPTE